MSSSSSRSFVWPKDSAEQVRFWIPNEWKIVGPQFCCLTYDPEERLLKVVAACDDNDQKEEVLHVIDPDDMIGVKLEVQLREGSNVETKKDEQDTKDDATPRRATNEPANDTLSDTQGQATLHLYCYPRCDYSKGSWLSYCGITSYQHPVRRPTYQRPASSDGDSSQRPAARVAHFQSLVLAPVKDMSQVSSLVSALQQLASDRSLQEKRPTFLILVNPHSGPRKNGWTLCRDTVRPMLEEAGIDTYVVVTAHAKHATELVLQQGLAACVNKESGQEDKDDTPDQSFHETAEFAKKDVSEYDGMVIIGGDGTIHEVINGIQQRADCDTLWKTLKIGVVGCGTGNGLATSIAYASQEAYGPIGETLIICKGQTTFSDISTYQTRNHSYTSFLTFTWAMVADIDIESEQIHWMGETRFDVWAVLRILFLRTYKAKLSYLPPNASSSKNDNSIQSPKNLTLPALSDPVPENWITMEDDFILLWASQVTHASMTNIPSPESTFDDGLFRIFIVRGHVTRLQLIRMLLSLESGGHRHLPGAEFIDCVAYRLEPQSPGSFNDIDGEAVEDGPIQGVVQPQTMQIFCRSSK